MPSNTRARKSTSRSTPNAAAISFTVRVADRGPGIPKTELKRVFNRFYRVPGPSPPASRAPAWACSSCARVAKRHGGRAWAESEGPGRGSTFAIELPGRQMSRILVVEDEQHLAEGLRFNLEAEGYQVELVETGEAALELLLGERTAFDLLVLDVMLPGKDGFAVMTRTAPARASSSPP